MNPYFLLGAAVAVALAFGSGYYKGNEAGQAEVQQQWDKEKTAQFAEYVKAQAVARQVRGLRYGERSMAKDVPVTALASHQA